MNNNFIIATGQDRLNEYISLKYKEFNFIKVDRKDQLVKTCEMYNPRILMIFDKLSGKENIYTLLLDLSKNYPNTRIIFLTKEISISDESKIHNLSMLITSGIYDICQFGDKLTVSQLQEIMINEKTFDDVRYIVDKSNELLGKSSDEDIIEFDVTEEVEEEMDKEDKTNIFMISSIKPGTGKSFVSTNISTAIAKYGIKKENGELPKVALVEADLQNLSVGTLLDIENENYNLFTALKKIDSLLDDTNNISCTQTEFDDVKKFVLNCFRPYEKGNIKNLRALVGSQLFYEQVAEFVMPIHYAILLNIIEEEFDIIIIDSNSSLSHITTQAIANMAKKCYYVVNLDFNNVRNNIRYQSALKEYGILDKTKYILNEDMTEGMDGFDDLVYTAKDVEESLKLEAKIPIVPKQHFYNCVFNATPLIIDEDNDATLKARYELLKIANQIYPVENMMKYEQLMQKTETTKKKGFFSRK